MKYIITIFIACLSLCMQAEEAFNIADDLKKLDSVVAQKQKYDQIKLNEIARFKLTEGNYVTPLERFSYAESLYREYLKWSPDSALCYVQVCKKIAWDNGWETLHQKSCINEAYVKVICGELLEADKLIHELKPITEQSAENKVQMGILMLEFGLRTKMRDLDKRLTKGVFDIWNTYNVYVPESNWRHEYYKVMLTRDADVEVLKAQLKQCKQPSFEAAAVSIAVAMLYYQQKDFNAYYHYLILSAINDIKCANNEASSLIYIVNSRGLCLSQKQTYSYAMVCAENAKFFNDQGRSLSIVKAYANMAQKYRDSWLRRTYFLYGIIGLLLAAVTVICLLARKLHRREKRQKMLLEELAVSNKSLAEMIDKEKESRDKMQESNQLLHGEIHLRNQNFISVYQLISKYISDVQEFKKKVFNLVTAGKYDKARQELGSNAHADKYLKEFFEHFDQAFLLSHSDFVERFNDLLRPECRIILPAEKTLTPELRIYALVSMGITDSVSIAQFLHYSPQTVYNYRLKIRRSSRIEERLFADTVAKMYAQ